MDLSQLLPEVLKGLANFAPGNGIMLLVGGLLIALAVVKEYEPMLLLPIGFGAILGNLPLSPLNRPDGLLGVLYRAGIGNELFPLLIFIGVGAMIDFRPLLAQPKFVLLGAAGQLGIFATLLLATLLGFPLNEAASIGIIGAIDGPTSIYVSSLLAPIAVVAYSYMSLVPIIQPPLMRLMTTKAERRIHMDYAPRPVIKTAVILFPIVVTILIGILVPQASPLVATLMLGNLMKEPGVVDRLSRAAQNEIANVATLFLGLTIGSTMQAANFINLETLAILGLGLIAFATDTVGGLCEEDFTTFVLMHAMGANTAGQLGSVIAGGVLLALLAGAA